MKEKIILIGAGSAMFTRGLVADIIRKGWEGEIALVDIDPQALDVAERLTRKMISVKGAPIKVRAATERRDVLDGATAVICTVGVGGRRAWEQDVFVPRKYGIYQPVGDSVMPGGTSRALRMIPAMVDIAGDVLDLAPESLFFNYSNPMGPVCRAVRKATGANMVGLCHGVFHVAKYLAGVLGVEPGRLKYTAIGMNHLTWFIELRADGQDAMPRLRSIACEKLGRQIDKEMLGTSFAEAGTMGRDDPVKDVKDPFTWQLFELFGAFPAVMDRHITEFFPHMFAKKGSYYGKTLGVDAYSFEATIAHGDQIFEKMRSDALSADVLGEEDFKSITGEHEQVTDIIGCIRQDTGGVYSVNLPNKGQIPNLPEDAIVECPGIADGSGLRHVGQPPMDAGIAGTLATRFQWVETVVEAALEGSRDKFVQALLIDGAVKSVSMATRLADELLSVHVRFLPQFII